jgi:signal transduction histidine kinase
VVRERVLRDPIVRVKIWTASGRIVYSDAPSLIGARYPLGAAQREALRTGGLDADVSDLAEPENRLERHYDKLLEVYMPIRASNGRPLLFEAYQRFSSISDSGRHLWLKFTPALIGALLLLVLLQLPLAWSMARRLRQGQEERETLLRTTLEASDSERRRIARVLHDGVVQELAGVSYSLSAAAERAGAGGDRGIEEALRRAASQTRDSMRALRSLLVEIYPPRVHEAGLEPALRDLLAPLAREGVETSVTVERGLALGPAVDAHLFRAAQEAIRNVAAHAAAQNVSVSVRREGPVVALSVIDDGTGFEREGAAPGNGHFGLRLLSDLAAETGGRLEVDSAPGAGTRVTMEVPLG